MRYSRTVIVWAVCCTCLAAWAFAADEFVTVKKDGTGDYTGIRKAINYAVRVYDESVLYPGVYSEGEGEGGLFYVDKDATGDNDGSSWPDAFTTIQAAVDAAEVAGGGQVWVAEGVYDEQRDNGGGSVEMKEGVDLYGGFTGAETTRDERDWETRITTIDGATSRGGLPAYHVVVGADNATLDGFVIIGGEAVGSGMTDGMFQNRGGGMYNDAVSVTVRNCTFSGNSAEFGGGAMYNDSCSPETTKCTFSSNEAQYGGAI